MARDVGDRILDFPVQVELCEEERHVIEFHSRLRQSGLFTPGRTEQSETEDQEKQARFNMIGVTGEFAVAKYLGIWWDGGVDNPYEFDLLGGIEVRSTVTTDEPHLRIKQGADDRYLYVLVTVADRIPQIEGWIRAKEAKEYEPRSLVKRELKEHLVPFKDLRRDAKPLWVRAGKAREILSRTKYKRRK